MSIKDEALNVNILLVDDDQNYLEMTKMYLEDNGMKIITFSNPIEALEMAKKKKVDIILLDYFMPEMTGEEFVKELRTVNNTTLVILQTGFAEKKPPIEMLTSLDIQGYYDKTKEIDELLLLTLSAIKTIKLIKLSQKQEMKIDLLNYKKQFLGDLIVGLVNEAKDQLFSIGIASRAIEDDSEDFEDEVKLINKSNSKLAELFDTINFESIEVATAGEIMNSLNVLLKNKKSSDGITIKYDIEEDAMDKIVYSTGVDTLIYIIVETVNYFFTKDILEIEIAFEEDDDKSYVKILNSTTYTKEFIKTVVLVLSENENVNIDIKDGKITLAVPRNGSKK
jgi:CheY-like chemotaxis protein